VRSGERHRNKAALGSSALTVIFQPEIAEDILWKLNAPKIPPPGCSPRNAAGAAQPGVASRPAAAQKRRIRPRNQREKQRLGEPSHSASCAPEQTGQGMPNSAWWRDKHSSQSVQRPHQAQRNRATNVSPAPGR
jgi:hypothetical protein